MNLHQIAADATAQIKYMVASVGFTISSAAWAWMGDNAREIGAFCSIVGLSVTIVLGVLNYRLNRKR